jgi:hypothetical protein
MNWWQRLVRYIASGTAGGIGGGIAGASGVAQVLELEEGEMTAAGWTAVAGGGLLGAVAGALTGLLIVDAYVTANTPNQNSPSPPDGGAGDIEMGSTTTTPDGTTINSPPGSTTTVTSDSNGNTVTTITTPNSSSTSNDSPPDGGGKQPPSDNSQPGEDGTLPVIIE